MSRFQWRKERLVEDQREGRDEFVEGGDLGSGKPGVINEPDPEFAHGLVIPGCVAVSGGKVPDSISYDPPAELATVLPQCQPRETQVIPMVKLLIRQRARKERIEELLVGHLERSTSGFFPIVGV